MRSGSEMAIPMASGRATAKGTPPGAAGGVGGGGGGGGRGVVGGGPAGGGVVGGGGEGLLAATRTGQIGSMARSLRNFTRRPKGPSERRPRERPGGRRFRESPRRLEDSPKPALQHVDLRRVEQPVEGAGRGDRLKGSERPLDVSAPVVLQRLAGRNTN